MNAIILAAGKGSRIAERINQSHKCLLPITYKGKEMPLIAYTIETLKKNNIQDISVVTGYRHEDIEHCIKAYGVDIKYNPFYEMVNSIGSLWFCAENLSNANDDLLILNADTFLEEDLYHTIINNKLYDNKDSYPLLLIDSLRKDTADVKVTYTGDMLDLYGKKISQASMAESLDIAIIPQVSIKTFYTHLINMMEAKKFDTWWESVLVDYKHIMPIKVYDIAGIFWSEIDFYEDYERILEYLKQ